MLQSQPKNVIVRIPTSFEIGKVQNKPTSRPETKKVHRQMSFAVSEASTDAGSTLTMSRESANERGGH